jgi:hypothetical protein
MKFSLITDIISNITTFYLKIKMYIQPNLFRKEIVKLNLMLITTTFSSPKLLKSQTKTKITFLKSLNPKPSTPKTPFQPQNHPPSTSYLPNYHPKNLKETQSFSSTHIFTPKPQTPKTYFLPNPLNKSLTYIQ